MPITEQQRQERKNHIGSSDVATVLGINPNRSARDLWIEKTGRAGKQKATPAMEAGNFLESGVIDYAEQILDQTIIRNVTKAKEGTPLRVNIDGVVGATLEPVEAKTSGILWRTKDWWGDEGTNQVPDTVIAQCHAHMICTGKEICHVPALISGRGFLMFRVDYNAELAEEILEQVGHFWDKCVLADTPPEDSHGSLQVLRIMKRVPKLVAELEPSGVKLWLELREKRKTYERDEKIYYGMILQELGDAEAGTCGALGAVTFFETHRHDKAREAQNITFRTLRHKKGGL